MKKQLSPPLQTDALPNIKIDGLSLFVANLEKIVKKMRHNNYPLITKSIVNLDTPLATRLN